MGLIVLPFLPFLIPAIVGAGGIGTLAWRRMTGGGDIEEPSNMVRVVTRGQQAAAETFRTTIFAIRDSTDGPHSLLNFVPQPSADALTTLQEWSRSFDRAITQLEMATRPIIHRAAWDPVNAQWTNGLAAGMQEWRACARIVASSYEMFPSGIPRILGYNSSYDLGVDLEPHVRRLRDAKLALIEAAAQQLTTVMVTDQEWAEI